MSSQFHQFDRFDPSHWLDEDGLLVPLAQPSPPRKARRRGAAVSLVFAVTFTAIAGMVAEGQSMATFSRPTTGPPAVLAEVYGLSVESVPSLPKVSQLVLEPIVSADVPHGYWPLLVGEMRTWKVSPADTAEYPDPVL